MARRLSAAAANAQADALARLLDGGLLRIYSGVQPSSPEAGTGAAALIYEFRLPTPCAAASVIGAISFNPAPIERALVGGTMGWFRLLGSDEIPMLDGAIGIEDGELQVPMLTVAQNVRLSVDQLLYVIDRGVAA